MKVHYVHLIWNAIFVLNWWLIRFLTIWQTATPEASYAFGNNAVITKNCIHSGQSSLTGINFTVSNKHLMRMLLSAESTSVVLPHKDRLVWEIPMMPNPLAPPWLSINFWAMPRKTALLKKVLAQLQHLPQWEFCRVLIKANLLPALSLFHPLLGSWKSFDSFSPGCTQAVSPGLPYTPEPELAQGQRGSKIKPKPSTSVPAVPAPKLCSDQTPGRRVKNWQIEPMCSSWKCGKQKRQC